MKSKIHLICLLLFTFSCTQKESGSPVVAEVSPTSENELILSDNQYKAAGIELGKMENRILSGSISANGMLDVPPQNLVLITAPFGGFLRSTALLQGMHVTKGQSIAVIENPEYIQLQQDFLESKSQVTFLEAEFQRQSELARENVNSQKTLQRSLADLTSMKAKNSGLRSRLKMLNLSPESLDAASITSKIELRVPITGYVTQVNSSIGAFVNPTDVLFRIVDTAHLHAELTIFERDIPKVKIGQRVRFFLSNEVAERTAKVFLIGREITADRTVRVHAHLDKEDLELIPGMYLRAFIETGGERRPALPEAAVIPYENTHYIFIKKKGSSNLFRMIEVSTGVSENGYIEIHAKQANDIAESSVVVKGGHKLLSKMKNQELD